MFRSRVSLLLAIIGSAVIHLFLLLLLQLGPNWSWPKPPIPFELVDIKDPPPPPPAPPETEPPSEPIEEKPPATKETAPAAPRAARVRRPRSKPTADATANGDKVAPWYSVTSSLRPYAPFGSNLVLLINGRLLRTNPLRGDVEALLSALSDYQPLFARSHRSFSGHINAAIIATTNPRDVRRTFWGLLPVDDGAGLAASSFAANDGRKALLLPSGMVVVGTTEMLDSIASAGKTPPVWTRSFERLERLADSDTLIEATLQNVTAFIFFGAEIPTPRTISASLDWVRAPEVRVQLGFERLEDADKFHELWPEIMQRYRSATSIVNLEHALDQIQITQTGPILKLRGPIDPVDLDRMLGLAKSLAPVHSPVRD